MSGDGLEERIGAVIGGGEQMRVAPDFGIESASAGVEDTHDFPLHGA